MKACLILAVFFIHFVSEARTPRTYFESKNSVSGEQRQFYAGYNQVWKTFLGCGSISLTEKALSKCLQNTVSKDLNKVDTKKIFEFLTLGFEVSQIYDCSNAQKESIRRAHEGSDFACFKIFGNTSYIVGVAYFTENTSAPRLTSIRY
jgi:hypothetical protein